MYLNVFLLLVISLFGFTNLFLVMYYFKLYYYYKPFYILNKNKNNSEYGNLLN